MTTLRLDDTIAAIATPPGEGALAVVRISGPDSLSILAQLFRPTRRVAGGVARLKPWRLYHGHAIDSRTGTVADEVVVASMRAPHSYTRQDMVEITGHGGSVAAGAVLRLAIAAGARPAQRGELTLRAFLAGRLDLAQAEAVVDAVRARTPAALSMAVAQLEGGLSRAVQGVRAQLMDVLALLEATIDFPEDDVPPPPRERLLAPLEAAAQRLRSLLSTARAGRLLREGMRVAIAGPPNAGKSSLLNALLQTQRAIVTEIPGTTRDVIEEAIDLDGIPAVLADTAGITDTDDPVERVGVARSREALASSDLALLVLDGSHQLGEAEREVAAQARERDGTDSVVLVLSKADLPARVSAADVQSLLPGAPVVRVSSVTGEGLEALRSTMRGAALGDGAGSDAHDATVSNARHRDALERAAEALRETMASVQAGLAADFITIDLRTALTALGEITGESVTEDLLDRIFSQFCIGK